jgi:hypothetical protein
VTSPVHICHRCPHRVNASRVTCGVDPAQRDIGATAHDPPEACPHRAALLASRLPVAEIPDDYRPTPAAAVRGECGC